MAGSTHPPSVSRRRFLQLVAGSATLALPAGRWANAVPNAYRVGVGRDTDAYAATLRAVQAAEDWAGLALTGKTVVIKPNLVIPAYPESGAVTDPEAVRALVDLALAGGAAQVQIVEAHGGALNFGAAGYFDLQGYGGGAVSLVDARNLPRSLYPVPGGQTYQQLWQYDFLMDPNVIFISAAKLKTHVEAQVTLAMKNLVGLLPKQHYLSLPPWWPRFSMHYRGLHQAIVDLNLVRPIDFAVVEGIWGMEGLGPISGTPIFSQTVLAGANALAVDRVACHLMQIPQREVKHFAYATRLGMGPAGLDEIEVYGDALVPLSFQRSATSPPIESPRPFRASFEPQAGETTCLLASYAAPCDRVIQVLSASDAVPQVSVVRTIAPSGPRDPGFEIVSWDGRADDGSIVAPGRYAIHVAADGGADGSGLPPPAYAVGWVEVVES